MNTFTPEIGCLVSIESTRLIGGNVEHVGGVAVQTRIYADTSYSDAIMRVLGIDDRLVVLEFVTATSYSPKIRTLSRKEYKLHPVGPSVVKALGLVQEYEGVVE